MAHVAKYTRSALGHMLKHYERNECIGEYSNENIDREKSYLNYNLAPKRKESQYEFIKKRCEDLNCLKRKDVNVMCTWVLTAPKDLPEGREKEFFEQSYEFLINRYGKDNVVSSYVHLDEINPHMHYAFVPVVHDKKNNKLKVSAKLLINRHDLQTFHTDLDKHLERTMGIKIGVLNEVTKEGNKSIDELKRGTAIEKVRMANANAEKTISNAKVQASTMLQNAQQKVEQVKQGIKPLEDKKNALEGQINVFSSTLDTYNDIDRIGKKNVFGKINISPKELDKLKVQAKAYFSEHTKRLSLQNEVEQLERLTRFVEPLKEKVFSLEKELKQERNKNKKITQIIKSSPDLVKAYNKQVKAMEEERIIARNKARDRGGYER